MSAFAAYRDGVRRVRQAPLLLAGLYVALLAATVPAALVVRQTVAAQLGASAWAAEVAASPSLDWFEEFGAGAAGLARDVSPAIVGFGAVVRNLSDLVESLATVQPRGGSYVSWLLVAIALVGGSLLSGGVLDRYARQRALRAQGFCAACGALAGRLLRLNLLLLLLGYVVLGLYGWLARTLYAWLTADLASERAAFLWALVLTGLGALILLGLVIVGDCARVRTVVEDRRSMIFALAAGARFARRHVLALLLLYALIVATLALVLAMYAAVAPSPGGRWAWLGFLLMQLFIVARLAVKLLTYASAIAYFQSALAHAAYVAAPAPIWPESPAIESLGPPAQP
jgi:hypothetical protein